jgi:hypothetical protein
MDFIKKILQAIVVHLLDQFISFSFLIAKMMQANVI